MKKFCGFIFALMCVCLGAGIFEMSVFAGNRTTRMNFMDATGALNESDWNRIDENVICKDGKLVFLAETCTADTKFVSKSFAVANEEVDNMIAISATLRLTALPKGEKFIMAFGLRSVEAYTGDDGNIEITFENHNGIQTSIDMYDGGEAIEIMAAKPCGVSLHEEFTFDATITSDSILILKINGATVYNKKIPANGEGRFGIIQTGSCGAEFSKLVNSCSYYDRPENTDVNEDFEDGEFNLNELVSLMNGSNGLKTASLKIDEYNGNKVLVFRNVGTGYLGTSQQYSNFELTFDVPFFIRQNVYNETGERIINTSGAISVGFGEENTYPQASCAYDVDVIDFGPDYVSSSLAKKFEVSITDKDIVDIKSEKDGFSVKITMIDGHCVVYMKKLGAVNWVQIAEADYENFRSGYVCLWALRNGNFAIDNFRIKNMDANANVKEMEYESSVITAEDYVLTEAEKTLVFRDEDKNEGKETVSGKLSSITLITVSSVVLFAMIVVVLLILKRKKRNGGIQYEEK